MAKRKYDWMDIKSFLDRFASSTHPWHIQWEFAMRQVPGTLQWMRQSPQQPETPRLGHNWNTLKYRNLPSAVKPWERSTKFYCAGCGERGFLRFQKHIKTLQKKQQGGEGEQRGEEKEDGDGGEG